MDKIRIGIVAAEFNYDITFAMVELAKEHAKFLDAEVAGVVKVPGVFDMPLVVKKMLSRSDVDGLVVLGAVIEGSTEHDEIVTQHAARKIADLATESGKPIGFGISGPGMSRMEAHQRVTYAKRAVEAAIKMIKTLREMEGGERTTASQATQNTAASFEDDPLKGFLNDMR